MLSLILIGIIAIHAGAAYNPKNVEYMAVIFRHGDRAPVPIQIYPYDDYAGYPWPGGLSSLSIRGAQQMYTLGSTMRPTYAHLLPSNGRYAYENMQVMSSAPERAIMSAQYFVAGFMPPPPSNANGLPSNWQAVPVHYKETTDDDMLLPMKACPKYDYIHNILLQNPPKYTDVYQLNKKYRNTYSYLSYHTGVNVINAYQVGYLNDYFFIKSENKMKLPDWSKRVYPEPMGTLAQSGLTLFSETDYMKRMKAGPLFTKIVGQMSAIQEGVSKQKLAIFAGHDITLTIMTRALDIANQTSLLPEIGAALVMELVRIDRPKNYAVNILWYNNANVKHPVQIEIPNCREPCLMDQFMTIYGDRLLIYDFDEECEMDDFGAINSNTDSFY